MRLDRQTLAPSGSSIATQNLELPAFAHVRELVLQAVR